MLLAPGQLVERYRIEELVADADLTEVYRVTHTWLGSSHALKLLDLDGSDALRQALLAEGRTMAGLGHPNLVRVTDALGIGDLPALVMDWVDGPSLAAWLADRRAPVPVATAVALFDGILAGVGHAHRHGVLHRDLKPENVLLARTADGLVPRVADFGIAKVRDRPGLSAVYMRFGTPEYMPPEAIDGRAPTDARADLFALGVVLYELLTGRLPFDGEDPSVVTKAVLKGTFEDPATLRPELAPALVALIRALLASDPDARPASCRAVRAALTDIR
ncbi:MAG: serine/threonine protein kinase [Deltaproteobacteria bacterium]|nr:serine/threonine protein kinase [Deltaproteobacteria bacterium]